MWMPRFRIRRMMVVVAMVAILVGAWVLRKRSVEYKLRSDWHGAIEAKCALVADSSGAPFWRRSGSVAPQTKMRFEDVVHSKYESSLSRKPYEWIWIRIPAAGMAEYHRKLKTKYQYAARFPWLSVEPDPPAPE